MSSRTGSHDDDLKHPVKQPVENHVVLNGKAAQALRRTRAFPTDARVSGIEGRYAGSRRYPAHWDPPLASRAPVRQARRHRAGSLGPPGRAEAAAGDGKDRSRGAGAKQAEIDKGKARITTIEEELRRVVQELSPATQS
jgi:hypothetical protein